MFVLIWKKFVSILQAVGTITIYEQGYSYVHTVLSFNTASGRYYCNSVKSCIWTNMHGIVSIPQAVGTIAMLNKKNSLPLWYEVVSIPQAVGTIAMLNKKNSLPLWYEVVSIPQAVGTIAMVNLIKTLCKTKHFLRFNTASGRYYCNPFNLIGGKTMKLVSIPQAVGTIAI